MTVVYKILEDMGAGQAVDGTPVSRGEWTILKWRRDAPGAEFGEETVRCGSREGLDVTLAARGFKVGGVSGRDRLGRWVEYFTERE